MGKRKTLAQETIALHDANARRQLRAERSRIRKRIQALREQRRSLVRRARELCRRARKTTRARVLATRAHYRELANRAIAQLRAQAKATCAARIARIRRASLSQEAKLQREIGASRAFESRVYSVTERERKRAREQARRRSNSETNEDVERNIPPELVQLWRQRAAFTRGSARKSRTEAFLQWVEEHPEDAHGAIGSRVENELRELDARNRRITKLLQQRRPITSKQLASIGVNVSDCRSMSLDCTDPGDLALYLDALTPSAQPEDVPF